MTLFGLVLGRWPKTTLALGTLGWSLVLLGADIVNFAQQVAGGALYGFANTLVGVGIHQVALRLMRAMRGHRPPRPG